MIFLLYMCIAFLLFFYSNYDHRIHQQQEATVSTVRQSVESSDTVFFDLEDSSQSAVIISDHEFEQEYVFNMIKSAEDVENNQSKGLLIFNNCVFKNAFFN